MINKKFCIFLLSLIVISSNCFIIDIIQSTSSDSERNNSSPSFVPIKIQNVINYSVELQLDESFTTLMNNELNFYVLVAFGSNTSGLYNAIVIFGNSSGNSFVDYALSPDISTGPLTFSIGQINMIIVNNKLIQLTFSEYAVYGVYPVIVSAIALFSPDSIVQFETDLPIIMNNLLYDYFSLNEFQESTVSSLTISTNSLSSTKSSSNLSIGFTSIIPILILPLLFLYIKRRKKYKIF